MHEETVLAIAADAITTILLTAGPVLGVGLLVGLLISIFQATTQIQEQTLSFIPKIVAMFGTILLCGSWILNRVSEFAIRLFELAGHIR